MQTDGKNVKFLKPLDDGKFIMPDPETDWGIASWKCNLCVLPPPFNLFTQELFLDWRDDPSTAKTDEPDFFH